MKIRTSNCYRKARYHKVRYYKALKSLADNGNAEALFYMITLGEAELPSETEEV